MILAIALALGVWHYSPLINELQYSIPADNSYATCGAVGQAGDGLFYADIVRPPLESNIGSLEFNTIDGAEAYVEKKCGEQ